MSRANLLEMMIHPSWLKTQRVLCGYCFTSLFLWFIKESNRDVSRLIGLLLRTFNIALQKLRDISFCSLKILHEYIKLSEHGKTVEINESMFGHKRHYNHACISNDTSLTWMKEALAHHLSFGCLTILEKL